MKHVLVWVGAVAVSVMLLSGCSDEPHTIGEVSSAVQTSASESTSTTQPSAEIVDVDPEDYRAWGDVRGWIYPSGDGAERVCSEISAGGIVCSAPFASTEPPVKNDVFEGPPNLVVLTDAGVQKSIDEGGPPGPKLLPPGSRITLRDYTCTTFPDNGIECTGPTAGFSIHNGRVVLKGTVVQPETEAAPRTTTTSATVTTTEPPTGGVPPGGYTEPTTPVPAGTMCGAATGNLLVQVVSGTVSCTEALAVMKGYLALPNDGSYGNANIREYRGWSCASPTAVSAEQQGVSATCTRGVTNIAVPWSPN